MMGQRGGSQDRLFYSFNLDDHLPRDHLLRGIDCFFDLTELRNHLAPFYSHTGRPSIDKVGASGAVRRGADHDGHHEYLRAGHVAQLY